MCENLTNLHIHSQIIISTCYNLINCNFNYINSQSNGGAIFSNSNNLYFYFYNSHFYNCYSLFNGGGIYLDSLNSKINSIFFCAYNCSSNSGQFFYLFNLNLCSINSSSISKCSPNFFNTKDSSISIISSTGELNSLNSSFNYVSGKQSGLYLGSTFNFLVKFSNFFHSETKQSISIVTNLCSESNYLNLSNFLNNTGYNVDNRGVITSVWSGGTLYCNNLILIKNIGNYFWYQSASLILKNCYSDKFIGIASTDNSCNFSYNTILNENLFNCILIQSQKPKIITNLKLLIVNFLII